VCKYPLLKEKSRRTCSVCLFSFGVIMMLIHQLGLLCKAIAKHCIALGVGIALMLGACPDVARAAAIPSTLSFTPGWQLALAASSRFAAEAETENLEPTISEAKLNEMRERRREWQSAASATAAAESKAEKSDDEGVKEKLNLDEITQNNPITKE
jgi:hypothetical protein